MLPMDRAELCVNTVRALRLTGDDGNTDAAMEREDKEVDSDREEGGGTPGGLGTGSCGERPEWTRVAHIYSQGILSHPCAAIVSPDGWCHWV